jgi:O-antigen/teichoic acid export membrane protein
MASQGDAKREMIGRILSAIIWLLSGIAILGCTVAEPFVRLVLDPRYSTAGRLIPWIIGGYLFHALFSMFQYSALHARKAQFIWVISSVACVANLGLNLAWVPRYGMYGAAYATFVAYAAEAVLMYIYAQRVFRLPIQARRTVVALGIFVALLGVTQARWGMLPRTGVTVLTCIVFWLIIIRVCLVNFTLLKTYLKTPSASTGEGN